MELQKKDYYNLIKQALKEDLGKLGDITSTPIFSQETDTFYLIAKSNGILCGKEIFLHVMKTLDKKCDIEFYYKDKDPLKERDVIAKITGKTVKILQAERTALNILSHLSGIASKTALYVQETGGRVKILDTRKTLPGMRMLQKYAVYCGGGTNHRIGLYDMVLIKDNHIDAAGSITNAVFKIRHRWNDQFDIEVETRNLEEVKEALDNHVNRIMLDNMDNETMKKAVTLINHQCETEASGNMTLERIKEVANTGVDYISFGELTHTITPFDFSLKSTRD